MQPATATDVEQLAITYGDAWNGHEPEGIIALHTDGTAVTFVRQLGLS